MAKCKTSKSKRKKSKENKFEKTKYDYLTMGSTCSEKLSRNVKIDASFFSVVMQR